MAFSLDGRRLASASGDRTLKLWDAATGQEVLSLRGHSEGVTGGIQLPDGRRVARPVLTARVKIWDATTGQEILTCVAFRACQQIGLQPRRPPHQFLPVGTAR